MRSALMILLLLLALIIPPAATIQQSSETRPRTLALAIEAMDYSARNSGPLRPNLPASSTAPSPPRASAKPDVPKPKTIAIRSIAGSQPPAAGNWVVDQDTTVYGENLTISGDILVYPGCTLKVVSSEIYIDTPSNGTYGIILYQGARFELIDSTVSSASGYYTYIAAYEAEFVAEYSVIEMVGFRNASGVYVGLYACNSSVSIEDSDIWGDGATIYADSSNLSATGLIVFGTRYAIYSQNSTVSLRDSYLLVNYVAIYANFSTLSISRGRVGYGDGDGLFLVNSSARIDGTAIYGWSNDAAIYAADSSLEVVNSTISGNLIGLEVVGCNVTAYLNSFVGNKFHISASSSQLTLDNGSFGNFWTGYAGSDGDRDFIGDSSFSIAGSYDNRPLIRPHWYYLGRMPKWGIYVYMAADNNLEDMALLDFFELSEWGADGQLVIAVLLDRNPEYSTDYGDWTDARLFLLAPGVEPYDYSCVSDWGEVDMGDESVLISFLMNVSTLFPAERSIVVIWNHGAGWYGASWDDTDGDNLDPREIVEALRSASERGFRPDVLGFDACLMASAEVTALLSFFNLTDYLVASEETEPGYGWPYDDIVYYLASNPEAEPEEFAVRIAESYINSYNNGSQGYDENVTMSVTNLVAFRLFLQKFGEAVAAMIKAPDTYSPAINGAIGASEEFGAPYYHFIDLGNFLRELRNRVSDADVANLILEAEEAYNSSIVAAYHLSGRPNASGLTVYAGIPSYSSEYSYSGLSYLTLWDELLAYARGSPYSAWVSDAWVEEAYDDDRDGALESAVIAVDVDSPSGGTFIVGLEAYILSGDELMTVFAENKTVTASGYSSDDYAEFRVSGISGTIYFVLSVYSSSDELVDSAYYVFGCTDDIQGLSFEPDDVPPLIRILSPANNSVVTSSRVNVVWEVADNTSQVAYCEISVNGGAWENLGAALNATVTLSPGRNVIAIRAFDKSGNSRAVTLILYYDVSPPTIALISPTNGSTISENVTFLVINVTDDVSVSSVEVFLNGSLIFATDHGGVLNITVCLNESATYVILVVAKDSAGRETRMSVVLTAEIREEQPHEEMPQPAPQQGGAPSYAYAVLLIAAIAMVAVIATVALRRGRSEK